MKYLVLMKPKPEYGPEPLTPSMLHAGLKWIEARTEDHTFDCVYNFPTGGGVAIANVTSNEEVMHLLYNFPEHRIFETEILPLVDYKEAYKISIEVAEKFAIPAHR